MRSRLFLVLALCAIVFLAIAADKADLQTSLFDNTTDPAVSTPTPTVQPQSFNYNMGSVVVQGYISKATGTSEIPGSLMPVSGAQIYFILNNAIVAQATSNPIGFYNVSLSPSSGYTVVVGASGFQTEIGQYDIGHTQNLNFGLTPIPFNGFVPYALYPVLETSPGREFECTIIVQNLQVVDQMVTFTAVTPPEMQAWFPSGEAMMIRSGDVNKMVFTMKFTGTAKGPQVVKVTVNGGVYFAEIPIVVVVKDLPFEEVAFWSYSPEKVVKPGDTVNFVINAENKYAQDKVLALNIEKPDGWSVTTGNGTELYIPDGKIGSSYLWVYVPDDTRPGNYTINLTVCGEGVKSNELILKVQVQSKPLYDAIIKGQNRSLEGYPILNLSAGEPFDLTVRVYNSWDFPVYIQASAEIGDNWPYYIAGIPNGHVNIEPGKALEFTIRSQVPNDTYGNYTARVYLESSGQTMTLQALINVPQPQTRTAETRHDWEGIALTGATAATFVLAMAVSVIRRLK
jgi:hypothetical protein